MQLATYVCLEDGSIAFVPDDFSSVTALLARHALQVTTTNRSFQVPMERIRRVVTVRDDDCGDYRLCWTLKTGTDAAAVRKRGFGDDDFIRISPAVR